VKGTPVGMNRYAYAGNDPINKSDKNGRASITVDFDPSVSEAVRDSVNDVVNQINEKIASGELNFR